jgi:hypothetical protein
MHLFQGARYCSAKGLRARGRHLATLFLPVEQHRKVPVLAVTRRSLHVLSVMHTLAYPMRHKLFRPQDTLEGTLTPEYDALF